MAQDFYRNQNPSERVSRLNTLSDRVCEVEDQVEEISEAVAAGGSSGTPYDPGDLRLYYENGKAGS